MNAGKELDLEIRIRAIEEEWTEQVRTFLRFFFLSMKFPLTTQVSLLFLTVWFILNTSIFF